MTHDQLFRQAEALMVAGQPAEALTIYDALIAKGAEPVDALFGRAGALSALLQYDAAVKTLTEAARLLPDDRDIQHTLANLRWMLGDGAAFTETYEAAIAQHPDNVVLRAGCADLLRRATHFERAEALLRDGLARQPNQVLLDTGLGFVLNDMGRTEEALPLLQRGAAGMPRQRSISEYLAIVLLRLSRSEEALARIAPWRKALPHDAMWIALESLGLRQLNAPGYRVLCDYERMVRVYDLPPPPGYADIAAFNQALAASLTRSDGLAAHPLDQTLRTGTQTMGALHESADPVLRAYFKALDAPIRAYIADIPDLDDGHPWSGRRSANYDIAGSWAVRLRADGYHVNHIHNDGWISSAYYVALPPVMTSGGDEQGWIKFGEPRWPTPGCGIEKVVQPQVGRLVLFPSYMWHGTIPFSAGERMTAPFDVVPA